MGEAKRRGTFEERRHKAMYAVTEFRCHEVDAEFVASIASAVSKSVRMDVLSRQRQARQLGSVLFYASFTYRKQTAYCFHMISRMRYALSVPVEYSMVPVIESWCRGNRS